MFVCGSFCFCCWLDARLDVEPLPVVAGFDACPVELLLTPHTRAHTPVDARKTCAPVHAHPHPGEKHVRPLHMYASMHTSTRAHTQHSPTRSTRACTHACALAPARRPAPSHGHGRSHARALIARAHACTHPAHADARRHSMHKGMYSITHAHTRSHTHSLHAAPCTQLLAHTPLTLAHTGARPDAHSHARAHAAAQQLQSSQPFSVQVTNCASHYRT